VTDQSLPLPGMEAALIAKLEAEAEAVTAELNRILREPLGSISSRSGAIERDSPLFHGTGDTPSLFERT